MDNLITYESIRLLSNHEDDKLIDISFHDFFSTKEFQKISLLFSIFLLISLFPTENAFAAVLEKTKELNIDSNYFFQEGDKVIKKLYREKDYRFFKPIKKSSQKIIETTLLSPENKTISNLQLDFVFPTIDLTHLFTKKEILPAIVDIQTNTISSNITNKEKIFFIRGGFFGYLAARFGEKVVKKAGGKLFGNIGQKFSNWVDDNSNQENISTSKNNGAIFLKFISPKNPYIYIFCFTLFFFIYRIQFFKLFKGEITKSFLKTNSIGESINIIFKPSNSVYHENGIFDIT